MLLLINYYLFTCRPIEEFISNINVTTYDIRLVRILFDPPPPVELVYSFQSASRNYL